MISSSTLNKEIESLHDDGLIRYHSPEIAIDTNQRIAIAEQLIHNGRDPEKVARYFEWYEFEKFANDSLAENGFHTKTHFVFKTRLGRRELDILAWNDNFILAIDCKHWTKGLNPSRMKTAAHDQVERTNALAERPDLLERIGLSNPECRTIMPMLFTLGDPRLRIIDHVPIVSVFRFLSFLYGLSPIDENFLRIRVKRLGLSNLLFEVPKP
jgi:hypothetical protein